LLAAAYPVKYGIPTAALCNTAWNCLPCATWLYIAGPVQNGLQLLNFYNNACSCETFLATARSLKH